MAAFNPTFKVDILKVFRNEYSLESRELKDSLRAILKKPDFKRMFSDNIIAMIQERTESGIDRNGKPMGKYSESYRKSMEFKIYKGMKRNVNLLLTGEMLASLRGKATSGEITIDLIGANNKAKAYGHRSGMKGHPTIKNAPVRDFLGLPEKELGELMRLSLQEFVNTQDLPQNVYDVIKEEQDQIGITLD